MSKLCKDIDDRVNAFLDRPLVGDWPYLWLDATYLKQREGGRIVSVAAIIAVLALTAFSTKPVKRSAQFHQAWPLLLEYLPDGPFLERRMFVTLRIGDALIFQPRIQLDQARDPRLGAEQLVAQIANLVLDLALLPTRGRRAGHRVDQVM